MQRWPMFIILLLCWGILVKYTPLAADTEGSMPFSQAREHILARNVGLQSVITETEAAKAGVAQAGAWPNPGIGLALDRFGANEIETMIEQTIELGGKRRLRTEAAKKELDIAFNLKDQTQLELEAEIIRRFIPIAAVAKKLTLLDSIIALADSTRAQIGKRVEAGAAKKTDLFQAEIEIEQLKLERSELTRENEQARKKFAALGGDQDATLLNVSGSISDDLDIPSRESLRAALANNPQLKFFDIEMDLREIERKQLGVAVVPDLNLSAGYLWSNADNSGSPLVGLSLNIPVFNKNINAQRQAELQRQALAQQRENTLRLLTADVEELHSRLLEIDNKIATLTESTIPKIESVYSMMHEYYQAGNASFLDLSTAQAEMLRFRMELCEIQTERAQHLVDLMQATTLTLQIVK